MVYLFPDNENTFECPICKKVKYWYYFEYQINKGRSKKDEFHICLKCQTNKLTQNILNMATENNMQTLRDKLFECIGDLKEKKLSSAEAKEICNIAQTIINSVKVEVDYMKAIGAKSPGAFMALKEGDSGAGN